MSGIREILPVSMSDLNEIATEKGSIRVGATADPDNRAKTYENEGYAGIMYVAPTNNMKKAENKLLDTALNSGSGRHNVHTKSNAKESEGYAYVIKGKKY